MADAKFSAKLDPYDPSVVFGERITPRQALGAVIIIAGTILYVRSDLQGKEDGE